MTELLALSGGALADAIIIGIILIFAIIGLIRGFASTLVQFLGGLLSLILAFVLCRNFADFLNNHWNVTDKIAEKLLGTLPKLFGAELINTPVSAFYEGAAQGAALPQFIVKILLSVAGDPTVAEGVTVGQVLAPAFAYYIAIIIGFVGVCILLRALFFIVGMFLKKVSKLPVIGTVNRLLGLLLGFVQGFLMVYVVLSIIGLLPFEFLNSLKTTLDASKVASFISKINIFGLLFGSVNPIDYIKGIISGA